MKTEEKAKKVQNIATALAAIFGAVGAFFGIFQAQMSANLKNQVTSLQNASQQTITKVFSSQRFWRNEAYEIGYSTRSRFQLVTAVWMASSSGAVPVTASWIGARTQAFQLFGSL